MAGGAIVNAPGGAREYPGRMTLFVLVTCVIAATGGLIFGYDIGISGGVTANDPFLMKFFPSVYRKEKLDKSTNQYCKFDSQVLTMFTSSLYLAALVASFFASVCTRMFGRKWSMFGGGLTFLAGAAINGAAKDVAMLIIGRILLGIGVGFANQSVPVYLSEMAPAKHRGMLNIGFQLMITIGILAANLINYGTAKIKGGWGWRVSLGLAAVPAGIITLGSLFLPDTPNSLIDRGFGGKAREMLTRIRGTDDVHEEYSDLVAASEESKLVKHPWRNIIQRKYKVVFSAKFLNIRAAISHNSSMPSQKIETGHQDVVHDVCMDYYGKRLATASSDTTIKIIGVSGSTNQHLATLSGHQGPVWQVAWAHPKFGSLLASCSYDGRVIIWKEGAKPDEWTQAHIFSEHKSSVNSIAWAPHELGLSLACGSSDGNISVFTIRADGGWDTTKIDQAHPVGVTSVSWAPSTAPGALVSSGLSDPVQKLVSGGCDNTVKVWKLYNGNWKMDCFPALHMHSDWVRDVAWAPNLGLPKSTIASASQDGTVVIWTVGKEGDQWEGKVLNNFKTPVWRVSWSLTGNILAVADGNNNVTLWKEAVDGEWQQVTTVEP